ncbi:DUF3596 domain-containing protein [Duganella sp. FT50W]|uniref:DUF3596 domain-containing protein n=2 Tax=Duganella lactea TaxID=2692173 RepID=A0A6L8ML05_9BURK|nr:DUF3596 domain-containing protein [Duganella lactea]
MGTEKSSPSGIELRKGLKTESIRIKFMYKGIECRESLKLAHTKANIKFAERLRGEILNAIQLQTFDYAKYFPDSPFLQKIGVPRRRNTQTVGDLMDQQFAIYERTLSPSTMTSYKRNRRVHLQPQWGSVLVAEVTPAMLRAWIAPLEMKARSLRQILIPLRGAFDLAVNDDLIEDNPLDRVKLKKILTREAYDNDFEPDPLNAQEITAILSRLDGQVRNVFQFAFCTGMRPSEYIALRWSEVDFDQMLVRVERSRVDGISRDELKTKSGRRTIDLRCGAHEALLNQQQYSAEGNDLVFLDPATGKGWDRSSRLALHWVPALRRLELRHRNLYQTRHTFASTLLSANVNPLYVAKQMGHKDTTMITRSYGRWIEQHDNALPALFERSKDRQNSKA